MNEQLLLWAGPKEEDLEGLEDPFEEEYDYWENEIGLDRGRWEDEDDGEPGDEDPPDMMEEL